MAGSNLEEVVHSWKMLHRPKIVNAVSTNSTAVIFSFSLAFAPLAFTLNMILKHVLGPYYVMHVLNMLWVLWVCNMSLGMLWALWNIHKMEGYQCKMCANITQFLKEI
jgi:hypothetical protein